jgi:hypothetical protein
VLCLFALPVLFIIVQYDSYDGLAINASSVTDYYYTAMRDPIVFDLSILEETNDCLSTQPHIVPSSYSS